MPLILNPESSCDVCREEFGPYLLPHCIPCGHVLCANCCHNIVEKTRATLAPVCPFCREHFTSDSVRLIRIDFASSGYSTPRRRGLESHDAAVDLAARNEERIVYMDNGGSRARAEARRLEDKVAKVAAKKCSVEEVSTLHKELQDWLMSEVKSDDQSSSLYLSAALLRAILMNHLAHSEASKQAKITEANLKDQLEDKEMLNAKLDNELKKLRAEYSQKAQESQSYAADLTRLKLKTTAGSMGLSRAPSISDYGRSPSASPPATPTSVSPIPPAYNSPTGHLSPLGRYNSTHVGHTRSASVQPQMKTPAPSVYNGRSNTPAPLTHRSETPLARPSAPGPYTSSASSSASASASASASRSRRLSTSQPSGMMRSSSDGDKPTREREQVHQRWIPSVDPDSLSPPRSKFTAHRTNTPAPQRGTTPAPRMTTPAPQRMKTPAPPRITSTPAPRYP